jgi:uncharacterized protein
MIKMNCFQREMTMSKFWHIAVTAMMGATALTFTTVSHAADDATMQKHTAKSVSKGSVKSAAAQSQKQAANSPAAQPLPEKKEHHLILQVNTNDPAAMNLTLNNAMNVAQYYKGAGENVKIEVVTFGPGLNMLRDDTSPVKTRIETMALSTPEISYKACGNTQENMRKAENKDIPIIPQAEVVKSGVVQIMQLQERGWTYVKP